MPYNLILIASLIVVLVVLYLVTTSRQKRDEAEIESRLLEIDTKLKELGADTRTGRRRIFPRQPPRSKR